MITDKPALPKSFLVDGFSERSTQRKKLPNGKRAGIMIGTEGFSNTGKTEFILSCPDPGIVVAIDRGFDGVFDNANPPESRRRKFAVRELNIPLVSMADDFKAGWELFRGTLYKAKDNADAYTIGIDCDSDSWELQRLAAFGKLTQIMPLQYSEVNAARRAVYARLHDSGKIVIATNKLKKEYKAKLDENGSPVMSGGKEVREYTGSHERQGFPDQDYLWSIQIRHLYNDEKKVFGLEILKAKANPSTKGMRLWGEDCNFAGLVSVVYPQIELSDWGL